MSMDRQDGDAHYLFREIERDCEALVRLIERAIKDLTLDGAGDADLEHLARAKNAAQLGANLAKSSASEPI
jgi:hypothetical protein